MIKPTIGRVVLVHREMRDEAEPALVTYVWNERMINVGGFDKEGHPFRCTSIQLLQDDDKPTGSMWAEWMAYQKNVASGAQAAVQHVS